LNISGTTGQWVKVTFHQQMELELLAYTKDFILFDKDISIMNRTGNISF